MFTGFGIGLLLLRVIQFFDSVRLFAVLIQQTIVSDFQTIDSVCKFTR